MDNELNSSSKFSNNAHVNKADRDQIIDTCLIAGRIMVESGSETYRVEDTMRRIAQNAGLPDSTLFTTPTGIFMGVKNDCGMQLREIHKRDINLEKISRVNQLSRSFASGNITLQQLHQYLIQVEQNTSSFPLWQQVFCAGIISGMLMIMFSGQLDWFDFPMCCVIGAVGYASNYYIGALTNINFLSQFIASFNIGALAVLAVRLGIGHDINNIIIGAVMPLVPGVAITNSVRDLLAGHLMTGMARGVEAILYAGAIGVGIALVFRFIY